MSKKESSLGEIKKAVIGVIVLAITTAGGVLINKFIGGEETEQTSTSPAVIINLPEQEVKKDTIVKVIKQKPQPKPLTDTEKRKEEFNW